MEPTGEPVNVSLSWRSSRSPWVILVLVLIIAAGTLAAYKFGAFSSPKAEQKPQPQAAPESQQPSELPQSSPVTLAPIPNIPVKFTFPDIVSYQPAGVTDLPIPQEQLLRKDAQNIAILTLSFADDTTGYLVTYTVPAAVPSDASSFTDVFSFYRRVTAGVMSGWDQKMSYHTNNFGFFDARWNTYEMRIVVTNFAPKTVRVEILMRQVK